MIGHGIHTLAVDQYQADPCHRPSLTASIAKTLARRSPRHAWHEHPRLNPNYVRTTDDKFDLGTAVHAYLLEGKAPAIIVEATDWRSAPSREAREAARAMGEVALLAGQWAEVQAMTEAIWEQLARHDAFPGLFIDGKPEQTLVWEDQGVMCRARLDWLRDDVAAIDDLKTTQASAEPRTWQRTMFGVGGDVQARFYQRGLEAVTGERADFRFVVVELRPPYALSVVSLAPAAMELADAKIDYALRTFRRCLETNEWPGYDRRVAHVTPPVYEEAAWLEREAEEAFPGAD